MKLKSLVAAVALAAAGASQAALVDSTDVLVNIRLDGADGPSMLINTNLNAMDLATGTVDSFVSDAALTQQINNFISGASGSVEYWVIGGYKPNAFSNTVLSTRALGDATTTNSAYTNVQAYIGNANNAASRFQLDANGDGENVEANLPSSDPSHFQSTDIFGNGIVNSIGLDVDAPFELSMSQFGPFVSETLASWRLSSSGELSYGTPAVIPVPAAVWLLGSALVGVLGISRRKRA